VTVVIDLVAIVDVDVVVVVVVVVGGGGGVLEIIS